MKKYLFILFGLLFMNISCSRSDESDETTTTTTDSSSNSTTAKVKMYVKTSNGEPKANYVVVMSDTPFVEGQTYTSLKQATSNSDGLALIDLDNYITHSEEKPYYFEAFIESSSGYVLKSITHPIIQLKSGNSVHTTTIIVN